MQDGDGRRRLAPWRLDLQRRGEGEAGERLDARAANDGDVDGLCGRSGRVLHAGSRGGGCAPSYVEATPAILRYGMLIKRVGGRGTRREGRPGPARGSIHPWSSFWGCATANHDEGAQDAATPSPQQPWRLEPGLHIAPRPPLKPRSTMTDMMAKPTGSRPMSTKRHRKVKSGCRTCK